MRTKKSLAGWYFLLAVIVVYLVLFAVGQPVWNALRFAGQIALRILPVLVLVFVIMAVVNYFVQPKKLVRYLGKSSGLKGWAIAIGAGIISTGPIYIWYPLLSELKDQGMRPALIATFLYNRAIKPALIPLMIVYFGLPFVCVLTVVMICASVAEGWLVEKILQVIDKLSV